MIKKLFHFSLIYITLFFIINCAGSKKIYNLYKSPKLKNITRIAVAPFSDAPGILAKGSGGTVADVMVTQLLVLGKYKVIERSQIERIIQEQGLSQAGVVDVSTAQEAGRILGVEAVVIGSVTEYQMKKGHVPLYITNIPTRSYSVGASARIVNVETGEILYSCTAVGKGDSYGKAADEACKLILNSMQ